MKKITAAIVTFLLSMPLALAATLSFSDVPQAHLNYVAINYLTEKGIVKGYEDGTFKAEQLVNRAEALKIILTAGNVEIPETATEAAFKDFTINDWFARFVIKAKELGIVNGNPDGTFAPARNVARSEFIKMLLMANAFKTENWLVQEIFADVPTDAWFTPYMNYAGSAGLISKDDQNNLYPAKQLTRGEVAEIIYLMAVIKNGKDAEFLLDQAEAQMAQVEIYMTAQNSIAAKRASELAVDMTQQAYKNLPEDNIVLGAAKLARAYDFLVNAFAAALQNKYTEAADWANQAIAKATEAWEVNNALQPVAKRIKDRANEILTQLGA